MMARERASIRLGRPNGASGRPVSTTAEPSLGELFRRLSSDTNELVRQEIHLARLEIAQTGSMLARDGAKIGAAVLLANAGLLALTAFLIVGLGDLLDNYWLAALVVSAPLLLIGGLMARSAVNDVRQRGLAPQHTMGTLREDAAWAKREAREFKRELTG